MTNYDNNIPENPDLRQMPGAMEVFKKPVPISATFAESAGICSTLEGDVSYQAGDAILTGTKGEQWPINREKFLSTYEPFEETEPNSPGLYTKKKIPVMALELDQPHQVKVGWQSEPIKGKEGDWLVQYGEGDYGIVQRSIFAETYERMENKDNAENDDQALKDKGMDILAKISNTNDTAQEYNASQKNRQKLR